MTRVGIATASYPRHHGDFAGRFVAEHARWLAGRGAAVDVVAAGPDGRAGRGSRSLQPAARPAARGPAPAGIAVHRVPGHGLFYGGGAPDTLERDVRAWFRVPGFFARYATAVRRHLHRCDEVVAHWLVPSALSVALAVPGVPLTAVAHSGDVHLLARCRLVPAVVAALARSDARLVVVAEPLVGRLLAALPGRRWAALRSWVRRRTRVVPMGIDVAGFAALPRRASPEPHIVFAGRLSPIKGADVLIAAVAALGPGIRVTIAGDGPLRRGLERRAGPGVRLRPALCPDEFRRLLASADLFVAPSRELAGGRGEGMPVAVREAMAAGVAVVASSSGGLAALPPGVAERVRPGDAGELARTLGALLADPGRRERLALEARRWVAGQTWDHIGPWLTRLSQA